MVERNRARRLDAIATWAVDVDVSIAITTTMMTHQRSFKQFNKFVGQEVKLWTQPVDKSDRVASHATAAPLTEAGTYLVEARVPGSDQSSRGLVVVTGIAIVQKPLTDRILLWVVDPRSGEPLRIRKCT